jgi:hypothetical protein
MAHYREAGGDHFDLLPFIAILLCVMGCLLLVTMSITALSIGPGVGEGWVPTTDPKRKTKIPVLIEWDGETAIVHQPGRRIQARWWLPNRGAGTPGGYVILPEAPPELKAVLDDLAAKKETHYALFAVRPSGFDNFPLFASLFRRREIDVGYEPIKQNKAVRLLDKGGK